MKTRKIFGQSLRFFEGQGKLVVGCLAFSVFCAVLPLVLPVLEGYLLGNIFESNRALVLAGWLFGVGLILEICRFFSAYFARKLSTKAEKKVKIEVLSALSKIRVRSFASAGTGTFTTRLNTDTEKLAVGLAEIFSSIAEIFSNAAFLLFIAIASPWLGLYTLLGFVLLVFVEWLRISFWSKGKIKIFAQTEKTDSLTNEMIVGVKEVKALGNQEFALKKADAELEKLRKTKFEEDLKQSGLSAASNVLSLFLSLGFVFLSVMLIGDGELAISTFFVVYIYRMHAKGFLSGLVFLGSKIEEVKLSARRVIEIVDGNRKFLHQEFGDVQIVRPKGKIEAKKISFSFHYKKPIIKNLDLLVEQNRTVAIVGKSGSGKSTLLMILAGELSPNKGGIFVDEQEIGKLSQKARERLIAFVGASPFFFSGSIRENMLRANPKATFEQIVEACNTAQIHDAISRKPAGYDTEIREQTLSSGEKKRLALARAILKGSKILLLDEPTQNLDIENHQKMIDTIVDLGKSRTVVVATHDQRLAKACDCVYELLHGKLQKKQQNT